MIVHYCCCYCFVVQVDMFLTQIRSTWSSLHIHGWLLLEAARSGYTSRCLARVTTPPTYHQSKPRVVLQCNIHTAHCCIANMLDTRVLYILPVCDRRFVIAIAVV